jgi:hypothetical protein
VKATCFPTRQQHPDPAYKGAFFSILWPCSKSEVAFGLLIYTLISENQGLEKLRSVSNLRKISGTAYLDFFSVCHLDFFQVYGINLAFSFRWRPRKKSRFAGPEISSKV